MIHVTYIQDTKVATEQKMLDYDKEQIISALYRALAERDTENRFKFFKGQINFHTYTSNMIPVGTMDLITKTIREYEGVYEDA